MADTELLIENYRILSTGADGGHRYISTEIDHKGEVRKLTAIFLNKSDERDLGIYRRLWLKGDLIDEGNQNSLMLLNSIIIKKEK